MYVHMVLLYTVAKTSETAFGVCYDACFAQINLAFGKYYTNSYNTGNSALPDIYTQWFNSSTTYLFQKISFQQALILADLSLTGTRYRLCISEFVSCVEH